MGKDRNYTVARLSFRISDCCGEGCDALLPSFRPFVADDESDDLIFHLSVCDSLSRIDGLKEIGQFDCGGNNHGVYQAPDGGYQINISDMSGQECCVLQTSSDFSEGTVMLLGNVQMRQFGLNNSVMIMFAFSSVGHHTLLMHSSVIRHDGRGYLFLGVSGTGKSTHTANWLRYVDNAELMNDDNPVVRVIGSQAYVFGSPWSGKTPCYKNIEAIIGAFVQLRQAPHNRIHRCEVLEAFSHLLPSCSVMKWDRRIYMGICETINNVMQSVPVFLLENLPDEDAVRLSYNTIAVGHS